MMSYLPALKDYEHVVVTLKGPNVYRQDDYEYISLDLKVPRQFFSAVYAIKRIVREKKIDIVHSHSYWTNIISRLATPKRARLFNHYHFANYGVTHPDRTLKVMMLLDKLLKRKKNIRIAVSEYVGDILKFKFPKSHVVVIPNFIDCHYPGEKNKENGSLKVVSIANCNLEKNHSLVIEAFKELKEEPISIDIIGGGETLEDYRKQVQNAGIKVRFCGQIPDAKTQLINYDLFLSASVLESFGLAVLEGVCARLPLLISDIPAYREVAPKSTLFFNPYKREDLIEGLRHFMKNNNGVNNKDYEEVLEKYSREQFLLTIKTLYQNGMK